MSNLTRKPLRESKPKTSAMEKTIPSSPRLRSKGQTKKLLHLEEELDSSINSDEEHDSENENNSAEKNRPKAKRTPEGSKNAKKLYPPLVGEVVDDDEEMRDDKKNQVGLDKKTNKKENNIYPKLSTDDKKQKEDENSGWSIWSLVLLVVVGCSLAYLVKNKIFKDEKQPTVKTDIDHFKLFKKDYEYLKKQFPEQNDRFWKAIGAPIRRVLIEEDPTYPAIVLLSVPNSQPHMGSCLTKKIVQKINSIQRLSGDFYIDTSMLDSSTPGKTRLDLDRKLHTALNSSRTVVLDHIEKLPGEAALLLHAFCDGDNAPYKNAVIFLVLYVSSQFSETEPQQEYAIEEILVNMWKSELGEDEMPALQSRIANNIAIMRPEKLDVCK